MNIGVCLEAYQKARVVGGFVASVQALSFDHVTCRVAPVRRKGPTSEHLTVTTMMGLKSEGNKMAGTGRKLSGVESYRIQVVPHAKPLVPDTRRLVPTPITNRSNVRLVDKPIKKEPTLCWVWSS